MNTLQILLWILAAGLIISGVIIKFVTNNALPIILNLAAIVIAIIAKDMA